MSNPNIGKPPQRERPPSTFQGGMRRIIYVEQPQPEPEPQPQPQQLIMPEGLRGYQKLAWLARYGNLSLPEGAKVTKFSEVDGAFNIEYATPTREAMFTYKGERVTGKELARIAKQVPLGYEIASIKREGDVLNIVYGPQPMAPTQKEINAPGMAPFLKETVFGLASTMQARVRESLDPARFLPHAQPAPDLTSGRAVPITDVEVFMAASVLASTAAPLIQQKIWHTTPKVTTWEDVGLEQAYSAMDIEAPTETMSFRVEQFARSTFIGKGMPTTPMSRTLELARGGIIQEAEQILIREPLIQPNLRTYLPLSQTFATIPDARTPFLIMPFLYQPTRLTQPQTPQQLTRTIAQTQTIASIRQSLFSGTALQTRQVAIQQQQTRQMQRQIQMQSQTQRQMQRQQQTFLDDMLPKGKKRKGKQEPFGLWGRYKRFYPVATAKEVMGMKIRKKDLLW